MNHPIRIIRVSRLVDLGLEYFKRVRLPFGVGWPGGAVRKLPSISAMSTSIKKNEMRIRRRDFGINRPKLCIFCRSGSGSMQI